MPAPTCLPIHMKENSLFKTCPPFITCFRTYVPVYGFFIDANEMREIRNETNAVATMLVVMPYTPDN